MVKVKKIDRKISIASSKQERMLRLNMLEQEARQFEQQLMFVEQQIVELQLLSVHLDEIEKAKPKTEMLASLGRNIFVKTELLSKDLFVDIGAKTVVKKSIEETKTIIQKDVKQLEQAKGNLQQEFQ
ncbi:hypothetical protein HZA33_01875, partial [Candidatus Pacearchaeota archaeon]|nr:hypothetical protein [Candidatus Pacearchaeota archaeon]